VKLILIVEDSRFLRQATERALIKAGYSVASTGAGEDALRIARTRVPDLILLDMLLPGLGGPEVLRGLKLDPATAHVPVVVLSSLPQKNETKLKAEGAIAYFEKSKLGLQNGSETLISLVGKALHADLTARGN
jgi:CheY-like chemotaxis protein